MQVLIKIQVNRLKCSYCYMLRFLVICALNRVSMLPNKNFSFKLNVMMHVEKSFVSAIAFLLLLLTIFNQSSLKVPFIIFFANVPQSKTYQ